MAIVKKEETKDIKLPETKYSNDVFYIRLSKASMFIDNLSGLDLNVLEGRFSGTVNKTIPENKLTRIKKGISVGAIEQYNPNMPEMTEVRPQPKKDLTRTSEYRVLCHPEMDEIKRYIDLVATKKQRGALSLKIMFRLETDGQNPQLSPRGEIIDYLMAKFKTLSITNKELTNMEIDSILVMNEQPSDIVVSV